MKTPTTDSQNELLEKAEASSFPKRLGIFAGMSGPGWIQAAVTLGGGSLIGALYLGVIGGYQFMWLQPLAMLLGAIMLGAISYVTLSSKERPFVAVKKNVSPSLAWGWLIATVIADIVFCSAQFSLGTDTVHGSFDVGEDKPYIITGIFATVSIALLWLFIGGGKASKVIDNVIKGLVAVVVLAFMGVVITLAKNGAIEWGMFFKGFIPDFSALFKPAETYSEAIAASGVNSDYWTTFIAASQRNVIITAFGSAVGINMTFLLPYSLMKKGWGKSHRQLSRYDLFLGLFVPFILATSFLVITTASQFHAKKDGIHSPGAFNGVVDKLLATQHEGFATMSDEVKTALRETLPQADKDLGVMLAKRDAGNLAESLRPFLGDYAKPVFGIGVLAMVLSTMIVHMMMNGYAISEAFGQPGKKGLFMLGALMPALAGFFSPILWKVGSVKTALVVPAATIAATLLPIAYIIFFMLMNSKKTLGGELPKNRMLINSIMIIAIAVATFASVWNLIGKYNSPDAYPHIFGLVGMIGLPILFIVGVGGFIRRSKMV